MWDKFEDAWDEISADVSGFAAERWAWFQSLTDLQQLLMGAGIAILLGIILRRKSKQTRAKSTEFSFGTLILAVGTILAFALGVDWAVDSLAGGRSTLVN
ncbi:MAG: hypothetical protein AAFX03_04765 [Pseudomonadota bacterium]